jgi:type VI secretion system secreted protein VgrG
MDSNLKNNPQAAVQVLAHEVGHATFKGNIDYSSKTNFLNCMLDDEGAAALNNIKVQREIKANGGPDIGLAGNPTNHAKYNAAYDQFLLDGDAAKAHRTMGSIFGNGEITSTTGQSYNNYYGNWYDQTFGSGK